MLDFQNANSDLIHRGVKLTEDPVTTGSGFLVQLVRITQSNARTLVHASTTLIDVPDCDKSFACDSNFFYIAGT